MKLKTILFDLDGTLLDSISGLMHSTNAALEQLGYPSRTYEEINNFVGHGMDVLIERAIPGGRGNPDYSRCLALFKEDYHNTMFSHTHCFPGVPELLDALKKEGCAVAVVSNKADGAVKELSAHFFGDLVSVAIGESPEIARKPAPDTIFAALKALHADRAEAAYVGDSEVDFATASNAGVPCFSVLWGTRDEAYLRNVGATRFSHSCEELLESLRSF